MASKYSPHSENIQHSYSSLTTAAHASCADALRSEISTKIKGDKVRNATMWTSNESVLTKILVKKSKWIRHADRLQRTNLKETNRLDN
jgi:hypothetical protein